MDLIQTRTHTDIRQNCPEDCWPLHRWVQFITRDLSTTLTEGICHTSHKQLPCTFCKCCWAVSTTLFLPPYTTSFFTRIFANSDFSIKSCFRLFLHSPILTPSGLPVSLTHLSPDLQGYYKHILCPGDFINFDSF